MANDFDEAMPVTISGDGIVHIHRGERWVAVESLFSDYREIPIPDAKKFALITEYGQLVRMQAMSEAEVEEANRKFRWAHSGQRWVQVEEWELGELP